MIVSINLIFYLLGYYKLGKRLCKPFCKWQYEPSSDRLICSIAYLDLLFSYLNNF